MRQNIFLLLTTALLFAPAAPAAAQTKPVDCVAAVVNGGVVTRFDVEVAEAIGLFEPMAAPNAIKAAEAGARRLAVLNLFIDQKLVVDQVRPAASVPDPADVDAEWKRLAARAGPDAVRGRLSRLGMTEADVRPYIEDKVLFLKILNDRFQRTVSVSLREIEAYYADTYVPARKAEAVAVRPLVEVLDAIEAEIKKAKVEAQAAAWIDALREQAEVEIRPDCLK